MAHELKVPSVGESIVEVMIGDWLKSEGDHVEKGEPVVELESDKATVELPAPITGVVSKITKQTGEKAEVDDVIGYMEEGEGGAKEEGESEAAPKEDKIAAEDEETQPKDEEAPKKKKKEESKAEKEKTAVEKEDEEERPKKAAKKKEATEKEEQEEGQEESFEPSHVMPAAQRALNERGLEASEVKPSGPGGRLLKEDVLRHAASQTGAEAEEQGVAMRGRGERSVPMTPMRKRIAERLVDAQQSAALLTTFNEVDMSKVMAMRKEFQDEFTKKHGVKLGFMSFFVKASVEALHSFPQVNAYINGEEIVYHDYCDIGIAVGGGKGLVVPIIRSAENYGFAGIEKTIADFGERAQNNKIKLDELQGGTFSISNGGVYGSLLSTPIVNPPQSAILGLHAIEDRPVAIDGEVVIRPMMYVALTYDHRIVDGREAVQFLRTIKFCVENPARMLLDL